MHSADSLRLAHIGCLDVWLLKLVLVVDLYLIGVKPDAFEHSLFMFHLLYFFLKIVPCD